MSTSLADGRTLCVFDDDAAMSKQLVAEVTAAANEAISKKEVSSNLLKQFFLLYVLFFHS